MLAAAQAQIEKLTIVSADGIFGNFEVQRIW
jgi:PIN domain nuclease of toxin-antitoxin system